MVDVDIYGLLNAVNHVGKFDSVRTFIGTAGPESDTNHTAIYARVGTFLVFVLICVFIVLAILRYICHFIYHEDSVYYV